MAKLIISAGADPNYDDSLPLFFIIDLLPIKKTSGYRSIFTSEDIKMLQYLLSVGAKATNKLLNSAIKKDNYIAVKLLLEAGANIDVGLSNIKMAERHLNKKIIDILKKYYKNK